MPTYEYECHSCGKSNITRLVKIDARNDQTCECGQPLCRVISMPQAPVFKGVQATCSMATRLPDVNLTTEPRS